MKITINRIPLHLYKKTLKIGDIVSFRVRDRYKIKTIKEIVTKDLSVYFILFPESKHEYYCDLLFGYEVDNKFKINGNLGGIWPEVKNLKNLLKQLWLF